MSKKLEDVGGLNGVMEILNLCLDARKHVDYQRALKIITPLIEALKGQPFVSNDAVTYVTASFDTNGWPLSASINGVIIFKAL